MNVVNVVRIHFRERHFPASASSSYQSAKTFAPAQGTPDGSFYVVSLPATVNLEHHATEPGHEPLIEERKYTKNRVFPMDIIEEIEEFQVAENDPVLADVEA